jgi:hypothetical protein
METTDNILISLLQDLTLEETSAISIDEILLQSLDAELSEFLQTLLKENDALETPKSPNPTIDDEVFWTFIQNIVKNEDKKTDTLPQKIQTTDIITQQAVDLENLKIHIEELYKAIDVLREAVLHTIPQEIAKLQQHQQEQREFELYFTENKIDISVAEKQVRLSKEYFLTAETVVYSYSFAQIF